MNTDSFRRFLKCAFIFTFTISATICGFAQNQTPSFGAVYKLIEENVSGITSEELNAAAVRGLLSELEGRALLVTDAQGEIAVETNLLSVARVYDTWYGYFRVGRVESGLSEKIAEQFKQLSGTNKLRGVILDLRFADGSDYSAAAKTADLFISTEQPLIHWGSGSLSASAKTTAISVPVAILINSRTRGAAEALAAVLRETKVGLLIGGNSAGQASVFKDFPLENGQALRVAAAPVRVGQSRVLSTDGLKPDIQLEVSLENERAYHEDPYRVLTRPVTSVAMTLNTNTAAVTETNRPRARVNEAELVRRKREGLSTEEEFLELPSVTDELRIIRDPAVARALDLLKGLALIQANRGF